MLNGDEITGQDRLLDAIGTIKGMLPKVLFLMILGVCVPILEEFLFRYWIVCKKTMSTIVLYGAMACYVSVNSFWWIGLVGFLLCLSLHFLIKNSSTRMVSLIIATSLLFASGHISGFYSVNTDAVLCMAELFGLGLVASWLVYNIGFWWACLLHAVNNVVSLLFVMFAPPPTLYDAVPVEFETPLYSASLHPVSDDGICHYEINDSTLYFKGTLPSIADRMATLFNPGIITGSYSPTEFIKSELSAKAKEPHWEYTLRFHDTIPYHNAPWLAQDLADNSQLKIDTTYEYIYVITIEDSQKLNESAGEIETTLAGLAEDLRIFYSAPFVLEKGTNEFFPLRTELSMWKYSYDADEVSAILKEKYGLGMYRSSVHKIQVISFSDCDYTTADISLSKL